MPRRDSFIAACLPVLLGVCRAAAAVEPLRLPTFDVPGKASASSAENEFGGLIASHFTRFAEAVNGGSLDRAVSGLRAAMLDPVKTKSAAAAQLLAKSLVTPAVLTLPDIEEHFRRDLGDAGFAALHDSIHQLSTHHDAHGPMLELFHAVERFRTVDTDVFAETFDRAEAAPAVEAAPLARAR